MQHNISHTWFVIAAIVVLLFTGACNSNDQVDGEDKGNEPNQNDPVTPTPTPIPPYEAPNELQSVTATDLVIANGNSRGASVSNDGRFVVFESEASNLVPEDFNNRSDIFMFDRQTQTYELISRGLTGESGNNRSFQPSISQNAEFIAFMSEASDLVEEDNNDRLDVFLYERSSGEVLRVSQTQGGQGGDDISQEARINNLGTYVVFQSFAENFDGNDNNGFPDIYRYKVDDRSLQRVSIGPGGEQAQGNTANPDVDDSGRFIVFMSQSNNFGCSNSSFINQIVIKDMNSGTLTCASQSNLGSEASDESSFPKISGDGSVVTFVSSASNLVDNDINGKSDVFSYSTEFNFINSPTSGVLANGSSDFPSVGQSFQFIFFESLATNLSAEDTDPQRDVFLYDVNDGSYQLISVDHNGNKADDAAQFVSASANGEHLVFMSRAASLEPSNLAPGLLTGTEQHIFIRTKSY